MPYLGQLRWDRHLACHFSTDQQDACPTNTLVQNSLSSSPVTEHRTQITNWTTEIARRHLADGVGETLLKRGISLSLRQCPASVSLLGGQILLSYLVPEHVVPPDLIDDHNGHKG
jgi:hypothetical protein